jgi:hypothetical protein
MAITTWRQELEEEFKAHGEDFDDVVQCTLSETELDYEFDDSYGFENGMPFTLWTVNRVYFPVCYHGSEWVGSVSRHPDGRPTEHQGG